MRQSDKAYLDGIERWLTSIHQSHLECPSHELAFDDDAFQRVFGAGDEQQQKPQRIDQVQFDHGHIDGDFQ